jgi:glycosyltransferase involved in cell wall biosynthesis
MPGPAAFVAGSHPIRGRAGPAGGLGGSAEASRPAREAIILSGWDWNAHNVPERIALTLSRAGWRILYCSNPATFLRRRGESRAPLAENVAGIRPKNVGTRLNAVPVFRKWQAKLLASQIVQQARRLALEHPIVIYPHGEWVVDLARELRARGFRLVHVSMDYVPQQEAEALAELSDLTLAIPKAVFESLQKKFGEKVRLIPQLGPDLARAEPPRPPTGAVEALERVPRPRLAYLGRPADRLDRGLLAEVFQTHPDWHFVACGPVGGLTLPNIHEIGWIGPRRLRGVLPSFDAGFMPYDCRDAKNLHCVPLKLFDYFAAGLPVVSTPLLCLGEYKDLVYVGETAGELAEAVRRAVAEAPDSPQRERRRQIAGGHSLQQCSRVLDGLLREVAAARFPAEAAGALLGE